MISRAALVVAFSAAGIARADPPAASPPQRPAKAAAPALAFADPPAAPPRPVKPAAAPAPAAALPAPSSDAPDPAVTEAAEANLESTEARRGLTFAGAVGGGLILGFGIKDSVGRGPSVSLRLGHVATRRTVITFELGITAALHKQSTTGAIETNTNSNLLAGAQYYVNTSLWVRLAGGLGVYQGRQVALSAGIGDLTLVGPAALAGIGLDLLRIKVAVLVFEVGTSAMISSQGVLVASGAHLGLSFD